MLSIITDKTFIYKTKVYKLKLPTTGAKIVATRVAALYAVFQQLSAGVFTSLSYPSATFGKFLEKLFFFT